MGGLQQSNSSGGGSGGPGRWKNIAVLSLLLNVFLILFGGELLSKGGGFAIGVGVIPLQALTQPSAAGTVAASCPKVHPTVSSPPWEGKHHQTTAGPPAGDPPTADGQDSAAFDPIQMNNDSTLAIQGSPLSRADVHGVGPVLMVSHPVIPLAQRKASEYPLRSEGFSALQFRIPLDTTRICIDVGTYISSPTSRLWWSKDNLTFVLAFEPNPFSSTLMTKIAHPIFTRQIRGYWPPCPGEEADMSADAVGQCILNNWGHITMNWQRFVLIPVALSDINTYSKFQLGMENRSDMGSLNNFKITRNMIASRRAAMRNVERVIVPVSRLLHILPLLPTTTEEGKPVVWDTLKIDAQGVDRLVIGGAGHLLKRFACIIGEFDTKSYTNVRKFGYKRYLAIDLGFAMITRNLWAHPAHIELFRNGSLLCCAPDVRLSLRKIVHRLEKHITYVNSLLNVTNGSNSTASSSVKRLGAELAGAGGGGGEMVEDDSRAGTAKGSRQEAKAAGDAAGAGDVGSGSG